MPRTSVKTTKDITEKKSGVAKKKKGGARGRVSRDVPEVRPAMIRVPWIGNITVREMVKRAVDKSVFAHAYGFFGPSNVGKTRMAIEMALFLVGVHADAEDVLMGTYVHPDILVLDAETEEVPVARIRELVSSLTESSFLGGRKVAVIANAECLSKDSANTLLKTLEEPRGNVCCILTSSRPDELLPTVMSRLAGVYFSTVPKSELMIGLLGYGDAASVREVVERSGGAPGKAIAFLSDPALRERSKINADFWKAITSLHFAERCARLDAMLGNEKVFGVMQARARELFDACELVIDEVCGEDAVKKTRVLRALIRAKRLLASNASPKAVLEWFLVGF